MVDAIENGANRTGGREVAIVLGVGLFFAVAVFWHLFSVNSEYYYTWKWQWIPSATVYPVMLPLAIPFFVAQALYARRPSGLWVGLLMVSAVALMIGGAWAQDNPPGFSRISEVVRSRWSTGYFVQASALVRKGIGVRELLARYPYLLKNFYLHPRQKPPGQVLFEMGIVKLFGATETGAMASGLLIGVIASFVVLAKYVFIYFFTGSRDAAFYGASYLALCPGFILFFPLFEQCFALFTVLVAVLWGLAIRRDQFRYSVALGIAYAITGFVTYLPGVIVIFLVALVAVGYFANERRGLLRIVVHTGVALATFCGCYLVLWLLTGFNPIATLRECARQVFILWDHLISDFRYPRHSLPGTIATDLYGFAITSGWISFVLCGFYFRSAASRGMTLQLRVAVACVLQFVLIAVFGVLQTEAARIWLFMLPMLMLPVGLELARWKPGARMGVFVVLLVLTAAMCQSMEFITRQK
jgi:hypothetical protein